MSNPPCSFKGRCRWPHWHTHYKIQSRVSAESALSRSLLCVCSAEPNKPTCEIHQKCVSGEQHWARTLQDGRRASQLTHVTDANAGKYAGACIIHGVWAVERRLSLLTVTSRSLLRSLPPGPCASGRRCLCARGAQAQATRHPSPTVRVTSRKRAACQCS